jgi:hypothetical protein
MPHGEHWLPDRRADQIFMAMNWVQTLKSPVAEEWNVPPAEVTEFEALTVKAKEVLDVAVSSLRNMVVTERCRGAFDALIAKMRFIKNRFFFVPPLTTANLVGLGLKPAKSSSPAGASKIGATAEVTYPGPYRLELHIRLLGGDSPERHRGNFAFRIHYGIMPAGGASVEAALGVKRELVKPPVSGKELPHVVFTRRRKEGFDFSGDDSGKRVYFCIRCQNENGKLGPFGPIFSAIIP